MDVYFGKFILTSLIAWIYCDFVMVDILTLNLMFDVVFERCWAHIPYAYIKIIGPTVVIVEV